MADVGTWLKTDQVSGLLGPIGLLNQLLPLSLQEMQNTLKQLLVECLRDGRDAKVEMDPLKYPSQILSLAEAILVRGESFPVPSHLTTKALKFQSVNELFSKF